MKIELKKVTGDVLFSYEAEENTIKDTVIEAIKQKVDLRGANLSSADLIGANLSDANLRDADLSYADLTDAD